jgi:hypothetical protein
MKPKIRISRVSGRAKGRDPVRNMRVIDAVYAGGGVPRR